MGSGGWRPILEGELAERALASAREVADALCDIEPTDPSEATDFALFWAYAAGAFEDPRFDDQQDLAMESLASALEDGRMGFQLHGGVAGAAWVLNHLSPDLSPDDDDDTVDALDAALDELLAVDPWTGQYDLISGLVGIGVHFADRLPRPRAARALARIAGHLEVSGEAHGASIAWHTRPELLPGWQREHSPSGYYNLGLAHGVPGIVALLAEIAMRGEASSKSRELLRGAVSFTIEAGTGDENGIFPATLAAVGEVAGRARTAWCYGDPGVSIALFRAAVALEDEALAARALAIAQACANRAPAACQIGDAGLCHGRAGLAHLLNRLHQHTGDLALKASAIAWFERTLDERRPDGVAGYPANQSWGAREPRWVAIPGILEGAAGVALALMAAASDLEPGWDRLLMVDLPVREA